MAEMRREGLGRWPFVAVLNDYNFVGVNLFQVYPEGVEAPVPLGRELTDPSYRELLLKHNRYNRRIFGAVRDRALKGEGVLLSWTESYRHTDYGDRAGQPVAALKSYILSPWTDLAAVEMVVCQVVEAREHIVGW